MTVEQLLQELDLPPNADLDAVEPAFLIAVKERIQRVAENYDEAAVQQEEQALRDFHQAFFQFSLAWLQTELVRFKDQPSHANAVKLKREAQQTVTALHKLITEYAACYMHINRFTTLLRNQIQKEERRLALSGPPIRWTPDAGILIGRYRKEKHELLEMNRRMAEAQETLQAVEADLTALEAAFNAFLGKEKAVLYQRRLTSALRTGNIEKAGGAIKNAVAEKKKFAIDQKSAAAQQSLITATGTRLVALVADNTDLLSSSDGKLFLKRAETEIAHDANMQQLRKIKAFLAKYHMPYMQYKLDMLIHLKEKLLVVGSLESLMILYKKLLFGIARPLPDIKELRFYESEVLAHSKYLAKGLYEEIPKILQRAEETVQEFRQTTREFEEAENLDLGNGDGGDQKAARG